MTTLHTTVTTVVKRLLKIYLVNGTVDEERDVSRSLKLRRVGLLTISRGG